MNDDKIVTDQNDIVKILNDYYVNIVQITTGIAPKNIKDEIGCDLSNKKVVANIVEHYKDHPSIKSIKENCNIDCTFSFQEVSSDDIFRHLNNLDARKAIGDDNIPPKILKLAAGVLSSPLTVTINSSIKEINFPDKAKRAAVAPIFKSEDKTDKKNYRPVSILNSLSKVFENVMKEQLIPFFENCLSAFVSAYRKEYSSQNVLLRLIEGWKRNLDQSKLVGIIFMDLSKAFDCIPHDLLIAKLEAYGLSLNALAYIYSYLKGRKQSVRINNFMSEYLEIISGVPQGSILGAILFNIFINDLFLFIKNATLHNYADDNSLEIHAENLQDLINLLQEESNTAVEWLKNNNMIPNPKKFQAIISSKKNSSELTDIPIKIKEKIIYSKDSVNFLGINLDNELKFEQHINNLCKKAASQLNALYRIKRYLTLEMKTILVNSFIYSNFNYCPLVWHITSANSIRMIEKIQERLLRFQFEDFYSSYEELLIRAGKTTMLINRLKTLCLEIYKTINGQTPKYMNDIFEKSCNRTSSRFPNNLQVPRVNQATYGTRSLRVLGPKTWNAMPEDIKTSATLAEFKRNIKLWEGPTCACNFCKYKNN